MLQEQKIVDQIEIIRNEFIQVREKISITKDGQEIASSYIRHVISKEDILEKIQLEDPKVIAVAKEIWPEKFDGSTQPQSQQVVLDEETPTN